jgi:hypothetical protein
MRIRSIPGAGTTVVVRLPFDGQPARRREGITPAPQA